MADGPQAVKVSFDRPYTTTRAKGTADFLFWEVHLVRWLEKSGYDVAYSTNLDTHINGNKLLSYKAFLSTGHDEYYTKEMYDALEYARDHGARYLIGCSSLTSEDPSVGAAAFQILQPRLVAPELRTHPVVTFRCPLDPVAAMAPKIPKLLAAYLSLGARICGPPALDRSFKTIDFLTLMDIEGLPPATVRRYLS